MEYVSKLFEYFSSSLLDAAAGILIAVVLGVLGLLMLAGQYLKRQPESKFDAAIVGKFNQRLYFWFMICALLAVALLLGPIPTVVLFGLLSFWALREFITMTPTRRGDHRTLFWVFLGFTPMQYVLVALDMYDLFTIVIPVYASLFIPARIAFTGDRERFLERTAKIQFGLLICVYALSHAAALLNLNLLEWNPSSKKMLPWHGQPAGLLLFFMIIVQVSDALHFAWDRLFGKHLIAETVNETKTWEGLIGAAICSALLGIVLHLLPITPFTWYGAALMALVISVMASSGSMTMSAIKRDRGVKDYGSLVQGHVGILDRIDSICFAAPIYFHLIRYFLS
ncbi:phosphatidate cytidylyltransferase [Mariniblastus fucicola]|uniref:Phosphatidate cytidylyltransferase n=1 Tax=Mariniblastus fucicola TaxID=980251 RepID=A0A5B9PCG5_9BACT|nr:phosphatidate cytidylyltransferase [Mariniblastus fucicola]QEG20801.1 Phosphatidate cytidylyltransferase [Mariniblastus fucicola]